MSDERKQTLQSTPGLPVAPPPESVLKWRRLVRRQNRLITWWLGGIGIEVLLLALSPLIPWVRNHGPELLGPLTAVWIGACCGAVYVQLQQGKHIQQTFQSKDITGLGCWIEMQFAPAMTTWFPQAKQRYGLEARSALLEQLPLVTEETAHLLGANACLALYKTLEGEDAELISVVLRAIPVLGDARALPFLRHLAEGQGLAATDEELRAEAQSALSRLQAILELANGSQGLLRASYAPQPPEEQLLHPVQGDRETAPKELLRADVQK